MKQPNWKVPLVLSAGLLALGSFTYWLQFSHKPKADKIANLAKRPIPIEADKVQVASFRIKSTNGLIEGKCESLAQKLCVAGAAGSWTITYPQTVKGDSDAIKDLVNNAANMLAAETVDLTEETPEKQKDLLDQYGLSDAKRTSITTEFVELTLENGKKMAAWFGETHPIGDKIFVASSENGTINSKVIYLIANFYKTNIFGKNLTFFRDKTIFTFNRSDVQSFEGTTTKGKLSGKMAGENWVVNDVPGDYEHIETFLSAIANAKVKEFPEKDAAKGGKSIVRFALNTKSGQNSFEVFEKKTKTNETHYYMKASTLPEVVEIDNQLKVQVDMRLSDLRQTQLVLKGIKDSLITAKFEGTGFIPPAEFSRQVGKEWTYTGQGDKLDATQAFALFEQLATLRAKDIVSPAAGKTKDLVTFTMGDDKNPKKVHFEVYKIQDHLWARDLNSKANESYQLDDKFRISFPFNRDLWKMK